ncbi:tumor necrosis factor receptor superfamily member 14-like isoform X4 [Gadus chalcogrammus]|uniref:tumor necrosis factor receptor superfamily member 14-like isoform X4 n=1 Tax=Gadus chalcogrammus TaxID=1042646 RepID=UPI0024C45CEA|nr:tumor necrosis factor receptor superfamily member 14-like isoform X4 [Gadus chalcogrammus]
MQLHQQIVAQQNTVQKRAVVQLVHQECMLVDIAQDSEVHHVHLAQKVLSKMATMGVNNALHVNIVMQVSVWKVKKSCSSTSDAVCEVLDGFFCIDSNGGGCRAAQRHTACSPGQYIGQRGTADKDTECLHCTDGTFSDGTSSSCQNHTKCESVGLNLMRPGTDSTDSECGEHGPHAGLVAGIVIPGVILVMALMALIIAIIHRKNKRELEKQINEMKRETPEEEREITVTTPLRSTDGPEPTRDQQECTITIPDGTMDDHHGDQSLGLARPSSPSHNGSVSVSVHQEDNPIVSPSSDECTITVNDPSVHFKRENGAA